MQEEDVQKHIDHSREGMNLSVEHLEHELMKVRAGKASPDMVGELMVPYYGANTPMNQVANISNADARTLVIQPWEKNMLAPIEKAIFEANLGITPQNDGEVVRISIPPLTEDRRHDLVKRAKQLGEDAKVSIRNVRREAMSNIKKATKDGFPEDAGKRKEEEVESLTKKFTEKVDHMIEAKEKDIMTI